MKRVVSALCRRLGAMGFAVLFAAIPMMAHAADVEINTPPGGGFAVKDNAGTTTLLQVEGSGQVDIPGLPSTAIHPNPVCFDANGALGQCPAPTCTVCANGDGFSTLLCPDGSRVTVPTGSPPVAPQVLPFSDSFDRPNSTVLGPAWFETSGEFAIASNKLRSAFGGNSLAVVNGISAADVNARVDVDLSASTDGSAGLVLRATNTSNLCISPCPTFYLGRIRRAGSSVFAEILKNTSCQSSTIVSQSTGSHIGTLKFEVSGTSLTLSLNNTPIAATTDSSIAGAGTIGVFANGSNVTFDNFNGQL